MTAALGLDTSNYTTSAAVFRSDGTGLNAGKLLEVPQGPWGCGRVTPFTSILRWLPTGLPSSGGWDAERPGRSGGRALPPGRWRLLYALFSGGGVPGKLPGVLGPSAAPISRGHVAAACWARVPRAAGPELFDLAPVGGHHRAAAGPPRGRPASDDHSEAAPRISPPVSSSTGPAGCWAWPFPAARLWTPWRPAVTAGHFPSNSGVYFSLVRGGESGQAAH